MTHRHKSNYRKWKLFHTFKIRASSKEASRPPDSKIEATKVIFDIKCQNWKQKYLWYQNKCMQRRKRNKLLFHYQVQKQESHKVLKSSN
jgi:hypothetical protein